MRRALGATAVALAIIPAIASQAAAPGAHGSWAFADYTPDATSLAADGSLHVLTGANVGSYCHGSRVPSAPQDVNSHSLKVSRRATLQLTVSATGVWGLDVTTTRGNALAGIAAMPGSPSSLKVRLAPGSYVVKACNLGGSPTATVSYMLSSTR